MDLLWLEKLIRVTHRLTLLSACWIAVFVAGGRQKSVRWGPRPGPQPSGVRAELAPWTDRVSPTLCC